MAKHPKPHLIYKGGIWQACYGYVRGSKYRTQLIIEEAPTPRMAWERYWWKLKKDVPWYPA